MIFVPSSSFRRGAAMGSTAYVTVVMSASGTPSAFARATTAVMRRDTSAVASARVAARASAPTVTSAVSGRTLIRPVPVTEMVGGAASAAAAGSDADSAARAMSTAETRTLAGAIMTDPAYPMHGQMRYGSG